MYSIALTLQRKYYFDYLIQIVTPKTAFLICTKPFLTESTRQSAKICSKNLLIWNLTQPMIFALQNRLVHLIDLKSKCQPNLRFSVSSCFKWVFSLPTIILKKGILQLLEASCLFTISNNILTLPNKILDVIHLTPKSPTLTLFSFVALLTLKSSI